MDDNTQTNQNEENEAAEREKREQAEREEAEKATRDKQSNEPTSVLEAKSVVALDQPDLAVGDHFAQKFANQPENPKDAPGLRKLEDDDKVRLELTDSDHPDPANPKVAMVHPDMVGDYLRAGWRQPSA